jgi:hypothetical protein
MLIGGMAQLARACVLHTQGYRFDPDYLQLIILVTISFYTYPLI